MFTYFWNDIDMDYSADELEEPAPSPRFVKLVKYLAEQTNAISTLVGPQSVTPIIARIVAEVAGGMRYSIVVFTLS